MILDVNIIRQKYDEALSEKFTRESLSEWATSLREASDRNELVITPKRDRFRIWEALLFLEMYDMQTGPDSYLYGNEDLIENRP